MAIPQMPRIMCAKCNRLVDRVEWTKEYRDRTVTRIEVWCHGDIDSMEISDFDLMRMTSEQIRALNSSVGVAFTTKRIAQKKTPDLSGRGEGG